MLQSMFSGASGLRAHQTQMDVIGNNIANINTIGFKSARAEFKQALSRTLRGGAMPDGLTGGTNPAQVGLGVLVGGITTNQTQGAPQYTGRPLDLAIEGGGFLALTDGVGQFYTRDGSLTVDADGTLVTSGATGFRVLGWNADPTTGVIDASAALHEVRLPLGQWALARQTSEVAYTGNLDASLDTGKTVSTTYEIFNSLGAAHTLKVAFTKSATPGEWTWEATSPDGAFGAGGSGSITFDENGKVTSGGVANVTLALASPGGANANIALDVDFSTLTSLSGTGKSTISPASQNGLPLGTLNSYTIDPSGVITGTFSNGMTQSIAQIAVTDFTNPGGLSNLGGNVFAQSANSGLPQVGTAGSGGRGKISSGYVEMSNVDLSNEFTNMIIAQRGFQANSRIITVSDEMLQELISMKR